MKAVLLAGGLGTRMREETEFRPKPMVEIGGMPVLWHIMKILSHHGIKEFVILTGYKGAQITDFFVNLPTRGDVVRFDFSTGGSNYVEASTSAPSWKVEVVWTGNDTPTGGRLLRAADTIGTDPFVCTYGDGLADVDISQLILSHETSKAAATMTVTQPANRFGVVEIGSDGFVGAFREKPKMTDWINVGYFIFSGQIYEYLNDQKMLEEDALVALANDRKLNANKHNGFWEPMDTFREYQHLNSLWDSGEAPWKVWSD